MNCIRCNKEFEENFQDSMYCKECHDNINKLLGLTDCSKCLSSVPSHMIINGQCPVCNLHPKAPESWVHNALRLIEEAADDRVHDPAGQKVMQDMFNDTMRFLAKYNNACAGDCLSCQTNLCGQVTGNEFE